MFLVSSPRTRTPPPAGGVHIGPARPRRRVRQPAAAAVTPTLAPPFDAHDLFEDGDLPREPQQARSRASRDALLEAAADLFARRGYTGTNTKDIAEQAGVSVGTLYFYFKDKRQILVSMLVDKISAYPRLGTVDRDALRADPRGTVHRDLREGYPYNRVYYGLINSVQELVRQDPAFARATAMIVKAVYRQVLGYLEVAAETGRGYGPADPDATARALAVVVYGFYEMVPNPAKVTEAEYWRRHEAAADVVYHAVFRPE